MSREASACEKATREAKKTLELLGCAHVGEEIKRSSVLCDEQPARQGAVGCGFLQDCSGGNGQQSHVSIPSRSGNELRCVAPAHADDELSAGLRLGSIFENIGDNAGSGADNQERLREALRVWAIEHGIKRRAVTALLKVLRRYAGCSELPEDGRTLLRTPREPQNQLPIEAMQPGEYCHFGLATGLQRSLCNVQKLPDLISLSFNVDGLPLSKSSKSQLWPIQCLPRGCGNVPPFVVGAFAGHSKPASPNQFLKAFVQELQDLLENGVNINGSAVQLKVSSIICDAPARAFITMTKGHGGYSACPKCTVEGTYLHGKVVFLDMEAPLRTDESFRQQHDPEHHKGESILLSLPIDSVNDLPLDYMHLVLLGVVKKLLLLWTSGPLSVRLGPLDRHTFDEKSRLLISHVPREFSRKPRGLEDIDRWKAVEFRLFLFYTGPLLLKCCLSDRLYQNFLVLHSSLSILANRVLCRQHASYAAELLRCFVSGFCELYGDENASYNIHCLTHLASDVQRHGELDSFSSFPFENSMQVIKRQLRKHGKPLEQLRNRMIESQTQSHQRGQSFDKKHVELTYPHSEGMLLPQCRPPEYQRLTLEDFTITLSERDNCFLQGGHVILARNIAHMRDSGEPCIIGQEFLNKEDFYSVPFESSRLGIYVVSVLSEPKVWPVHKVQKMVRLPWDKKFLVLPELHTM